MGLWCLPYAYPHWWCHRRGLWRWSLLEKCCGELQEMVNPVGGSCCWTCPGVVLPLLPGAALGTRGLGQQYLFFSAPQATLQVMCLALAEPRTACLPHKETSAFAFCLLFFPLCLRCSQGASPPAVPWHRAAIKRWKPGSESSSDRLPGAGRPGPKSIVHTRKLSRVTWQVFKALENFTRKFSSFPAPFPRSASSQVLGVCHFGS